MPNLFSIYSHSALQIFQREAHPSAYKAGTSNSGKEGLSLFGKDIFERSHAKRGLNVIFMEF